MVSENEKTQTCGDRNCVCCKGEAICPQCPEHCQCGQPKSHIGFDDWIEDMEDGEQPEACSIDNADCENCGS